MSIRANCPKCGHSVELNAGHASARVRCAACSAIFQVPQSAAAAQSDGGAGQADTWTVMTEDGQIHGPLERAEVAGWFSDGRLPGDCLLRSPGSNTWQPAADYQQELAELSPAESEDSGGYALAPDTSTGRQPTGTHVGASPPTVHAPPKAAPPAGNLSPSGDFPPPLPNRRFWVVPAMSSGDVGDVEEEPLDQEIAIKVRYIAYGLMLVGGAGLLLHFAALVTALFWGVPETPGWLDFSLQTSTHSGNIFMMLMGAIILLSAIKMRTLESYGFAVTACVLSLVPGISPCACLGVPLGVGALYVLLQGDVRRAFRD